MNMLKKKERTISEVQAPKLSFKDSWGINDPMFEKKLELFLKSRDTKVTQAEKVAFLRRYIGLPQLDVILAKAAGEL